MQTQHEIRNALVVVEKFLKDDIINEIDEFRDWIS